MPDEICPTCGQTIPKDAMCPPAASKLKCHFCPNLADLLIRGIPVCLADKFKAGKFPPRRAT